MVHNVNTSEVRVTERFNRHGLSFCEENFHIYTPENSIIEVAKFTKGVNNQNDTFSAGSVENLQVDSVVTSEEPPSGKPLLFVHGWGLTARSYHEPLSHLTPDYDVYAPTLPGFGRSSPLRSGFSLDDYADSVNKVWGGCELADEGVPIVAHSMGGGIAVKLALMTDNVVTSLTLVCPIGGGGSMPQWGKLVSSLKSDITFDMINHAKDSLPHFFRHPRSAARSAYLAKTADLSKELNLCVDKGISVNIVFATQDSITPPGTIEKIEGVNYFTQEGTHGWLLKDPSTFRMLMSEILTSN